MSTLPFSGPGNSSSVSEYQPPEATYGGLLAVANDEGEAGRAEVPIVFAIHGKFQRAVYGHRNTSRRMCITARQGFLSTWLMLRTNRLAGGCGLGEHCRKTVRRCIISSSYVTASCASGRGFVPQATLTPARLRRLPGRGDNMSRSGRSHRQRRHE